MGPDTAMPDPIGSIHRHSKNHLEKQFAPTCGAASRPAWADLFAEFVQVAA